MSGMIEQARAKVASGGKQLASIDFHTLGLDLARSLTATGGVGSVLAISKTQTSGYYTRTYLYDGNGNVISLCKPDTGTITANYTYSPFGKRIKSEGIDKQIAGFTFSTKYADETELSYYGFRFYSSKLGRWLKRDPIKENGSNNIFNFCQNMPINTIDIYGLDFTIHLPPLIIPSNPNEPWQDGMRKIGQPYEVYMGIGRKYDAASCTCIEFKRYRSDQKVLRYKYKHAISITTIIIVSGVDLPLSDVKSRIIDEVIALLGTIKRFNTISQLYSFIKNVYGIITDVAGEVHISQKKIIDYNAIIIKHDSNIPDVIKGEPFDVETNRYKSSPSGCPEFFAPPGD